MNVCAGSWLIASVFIDRTMHRSSATSGRCGNSSLISMPALAVLLEAPLRAEAGELRALQLRDRLALRDRLGHRLAVPLRELRLVVEQFEVARPAGHHQEDDALGLRRNVRLRDDASGRSTLAARRLGEERRERDRADAAAGVAEEGAALEQWMGSGMTR